MYVGQTNILVFCKNLFVSIQFGGLASVGSVKQCWYSALTGVCGQLHDSPQLLSDRDVSSVAAKDPLLFAECFEYVLLVFFFPTERILQMVESPTYVGWCFHLLDRASWFLVKLSGSDS